MSEKSEFKQKQYCSSTETYDDYKTAKEACPHICIFTLAPTPSLPCPTKVECTKRPDKFFFKFSGGKCIDSENSQADKFSCEDIEGSGIFDKSHQYYLEFSDKDNKEIYFTGLEYIGSELELLPEKSKFPADMRVNIYTGVDKSILKQTLIFHSSCSKNLFTGDSFGAVTLVGFVSDYQNERCCNPDTDPECQVSTECNEECKERPDSFFFQLTGGDCEDSDNSQKSEDKKKK